MYHLPVFHQLIKRLAEPRRFLQVIAGPRQTGKTTAARQVIQAVGMQTHYASADEPMLRDRIWIEQQWETARSQCHSGTNKQQGLLVLDEIQKIPGWSETVKRLWDADTRSGLCLHVVVLGSSTLLMQQGLTESLAGRFELLAVTHWSYSEMRDAFKFDVNSYIYFGGYPGAAEITNDYLRWAGYIRDSLIETSVSRDIMLMTRVHKPALLRRLFELGCSYSGQILSYQKMIGQLQDAGNTTTLAHYLKLLQNAGLLAGLQKYAGQLVRQRASSPKLVIMNTALMTASSGMTFAEARDNPEFWGRLVESSVGATLINSTMGKPIDVFYWAKRNREVDFVLCRGKNLVAIEVKSGQRRGALPGIDAFSKEFPVTKKLLVGADGIPIEQFLETPIEYWLEK